MDMRDTSTAPVDGATRALPCYRAHRIVVPRDTVSVTSTDSGAPRPQPKDHTMSENIEDLKARLAEAEAAAKAAEAEAARAKAEALRLQLEAAGAAADAPAAAGAETAEAEVARAAADALRSQVEAAETTPEVSVPASEAAQASSEVSDGLSAFASGIMAAYSWDVPAVTIGTLIEDGARVPGVSAAMPVPMFNRHLLVAGATGTGKTRTLQLLAEGLSAAGSSVLLCDVKGDLTGLAEAGASSEKLLSRTAANGQAWAPTSFPIELLSLGGADSQFPGVPVRAEVSDFGPILLARALSLNTTQEQALQLIFAWADGQGLELVDLPDLRAVISFLTSDEGKDELATIGGVSKATAGVILRALTALESQGGGQFFGAPRLRHGRPDAHGFDRTRHHLPAGHGRYFLAPRPGQRRHHVPAGQPVRDSA